VLEVYNMYINGLELNRYLKSTHLLHWLLVWCIWNSESLNLVGYYTIDIICSYVRHINIKICRSCNSYSFFSLPRNILLGHCFIFHFHKISILIKIENKIIQRQLLKTQISVVYRPFVQHVLVFIMAIIMY